jgi:hypothetical protein
LFNESEVLRMPHTFVKKTGVTTPLAIIVILMLLIILSSTASAAMLGDVNNDGSINVLDVVLVKGYVLGLTTLTEAQKETADVNRDGAVNVLDVTLITQMSLGLISEFPVSPTTVPAAPALTAPAVNASVSTSTITFQWVATSGADKYELEVIRVSDNAVFKSEVLGNVTSSIQSSFPGDGTQFKWRLRAGNSAGWGPWSAYRYFANGAVPAAPTLFSPAHNANAASTSIMFEWVLSSGANKYELEIRKASDNSLYRSVPLGNVSASIQTGFLNDGTQYKWRVRAGNATGWSVWSDYRTFNNGILPAAPTLLVPANYDNVPSISISFQWNASAGANKYQLEIVKVSNGAVFRNLVLGNVTATTQTGFPNDSSQFKWRVRAGSNDGWGLWSDYRFFNNGNLPAAPILRSPANNASTLSTSIMFEWYKSLGANRYELEIRRASDNSLFRNVPLGDASASLQTGFPDVGMQYKWRVKAGNDIGWGDWSEYRYFIRGYLLAAPALITPNNNVTVGGTSVSFSWAAASGATKYELQVIRVSDGMLFRNAFSYGTSTTQGGFLNDGTQFSWRVRAGNDTGWGAWSPYRNFINETPPAGAPTAPALTSPGDDTLVTGTSVTFNWVASGDADVYQIEVVRASNGAVFKNEVLGNVTTTSQTGFPNDGTEFMWRVRAKNDTGWGAWSFYRTFTNGFWWVP